MGIYLFLKNNKYYFLGLAVLLWVVLANIFPAGYVFDGGDTPQLLDPKNNFLGLFYTWEARSSIFYLIFYFLGLLGVSDTAQLSFYLAIFIFGSYISFDIFVRMIFPKTSKLSRMLASLFYALNLYTLFIFTTNWGYSHFQSLYIFIPLAVGTYIKFLGTKNNFWGSLFVLSLLLASAGFGNPAFALSFAIMLFILTLCLFIFRIVKPEKELFFKLFIAAIFSLLVNLYWVLPMIPQMESGVEGLFYTNVIDLNQWLVSTSNPVFDSLRLLNYTQDHFPENFPYSSILFLKDFFIILSFLPALVIFYAASKARKFESRNIKYFFAFLGMIVFLVMLMARVRPPFETINFFLFNTWGLNTLRSLDKFSVYMPFIFAVLILVFLIEFRKNKLAYFLILAMLLTPLPFYFGKLQQNLSYRFSNAKAENKDYRKSKLSFLVKIPKEYYKIKDVINNDKGKSFIATLPFSSSDGSGISNYPKWKLYGIDITKYLYNKDLIEANRNYFGQWSFSESLNEDYSGNYDWVVKLLGMMDAKYLIYHKDTTDDAIQQSQDKIISLEKEGLIKKLEDNSYFSLYQINGDYVIPYISWQKDNAEFENNPEMIKRSIENIKNNARGADFKEISRKNFVVNFEKNDFSQDIVLAEPYNALWKAYAVDGKGNKAEIKNHFVARGYANGWKIENNSGIKEIIIQYYPAWLIWRGLLVSFVTTLFLLAYLLRYYYVEKNKTAK